MSSVLEIEGHTTCRFRGHTVSMYSPFGALRAAGAADGLVAMRRKRRALPRSHAAGNFVKDSQDTSDSDEMPSLEVETYKC